MQLVYLIEDDVMKITIHQKIGDKLLTRIYPVPDLYQRGAIPSDLETAIMRAIEPESWDIQNGPGSITYVSKSESLVIRHTRAAHDQILQLLRDLRDAKRPAQAAPQAEGSPRTIWKPKRPRHGETYSLVGNMDLDGDDEDDSQQLRELIQGSGGKIDNQVDDQGVLRVGGKVPDDGKPRVTEKTKFVIVGKIPEIAETTNADEIATILKIAEYRKEIEDQARSQGVRMIRLGDFLDYIGYEPTETKTVKPRETRPARQ